MDPARPVLVTGAAGFVGTHLLDLLEPDTPPLVAWRRPGEPLPPAPVGRRARWMEVEILDPAAVRSAVEAVRPSMVYHLAGAAHAGQSWDHVAATLRVNVMGTHHLLAALAATSGRPGDECRVLVPGSALVYAPRDRPVTESDPIAPDSPYGLSKLAQEMTAQAGASAGLAVILTRSFNHIGPRQAPSFFAASFARQIACIERGMAEPVLRVGNLDARRDLTDVRDTVRAYAALMRRGQPGRLYNVCSGRAYRVGDILDGLLARTAARIEMRPDTALYRPRDTAVLLGDHARVTAEVGWTPGISMEQTLDDLLAYWRDAVRAAPNA